MKGLKLASLAMASLMALSVVGCGPQEDPKVRFLRECKQSLSADECQQLAYNKSQEEQARIMKSGTYNSYANQPGGYSTPSQPQYQQGYGQPQYVQPNNGFADTATGAVVGLAAGAAIGHAIGSSNNTRNVDSYDQRQYDQRQYERQQRELAQRQKYQQQVNDANQYRQKAVPAFVDTNKTTRFAAPSAPAAAPASQPTQARASSPFSKPAAAPAYSAPKASTPSRAATTSSGSSYKPRPSVFQK